MGTRWHTSTRQTLMHVGRRGRDGPVRIGCLVGGIAILPNLPEGALSFPDVSCSDAERDRRIKGFNARLASGNRRTGAAVVGTRVPRSQRRGEEEARLRVTLRKTSEGLNAVSARLYISLFALLLATSSSVSSQGPREGQMVRLSPDGVRAFVTNRGAEGTLSIISLAGEAPPVVIPKSQGAEGLAVILDGREVWVVNRIARSLDLDRRYAVAQGDTDHRGAARCASRRGVSIGPRPRQSSGDA